MSEKKSHCPAGRLASTKGLHGRARRYACDPEMEPFALLTDRDLEPLAAALAETQRLAGEAWRLCKG